MRNAVVLFLTASLVIGCSGDLGNGEEIPPGCGDGVKSAAEVCDQADLGGATCASAVATGWNGVVSCTASCKVNVAGCTTPATNWSQLNDVSKWSSFDVSAPHPQARGFARAVFDGRYLYFVPLNNGAFDGVVARFDTTLDLGNTNAWQTFDISSVNLAAKGFSGGGFDGRYVYFVPYNDHGNVARFDTQGAFIEKSSWNVFNVSTRNDRAKGFSTAVFDGRYLYLSPLLNLSSTVARYDTQGDFNALSSWGTFDVASVDENAKGFPTSVFDGRYLYLVPYGNTTTHGFVMRYDTREPEKFADKAAWTAYNIASISGGAATGFGGATFDGRYIYLVQHRRSSAPGDFGGLVARYDTMSGFTAEASWKFFDVAAQVNGDARGFFGTAFDGRYVYLVPHDNGTPTEPYRPSGLVARYDTQAAFETSASWSTFDVSYVQDAKRFRGGAFDGKYIYLVPNLDTGRSMVMRFDAKSAAWLPRGWSAAFD